MYADYDSRFAHPSAANASPDNTIPSSWPTHRVPPSGSHQPLTPPPEMTSGPYATPSSYHSQENGLMYPGHVTGLEAYKLPTASYPQEVSNAEFGRNAATARHPSQPLSRPYSPHVQQRRQTVEHSQEQPHQLRGSRAGSIAPSFQIPKSVNDSGGSLSELAAQITCLFWFESSTLLQQIEDSVIPLQPARPLASDAKPSSGFRKWVTTLLSTTLVAQNVVLLALLFIYRLKKLNPSVQGKPGSEYRLLTVALMLGNKFLDDNTYTNRTWAEVSGINVNEVHIMEVEFLSNMKYCLFTTPEDWATWQSLLGKFAAYFERASKPLVSAVSGPILPPTSSLHLPMALPSPPVSNQASPSYLADLASSGTPYGAIGLPGPSPAPSPHVFASNDFASRQNPRKRSHDEHAAEPAAKRQANTYPGWQSPRHYTTPQNSQLARLTLPGLSNHPAQGSHSHASMSQQLPPLTVPARAMAMVYPSTSVTTQPSMPQIQAFANVSQPPSSQHQSRQQSPYPTSAAGSPSSGALPNSATALYPPVQVSPTYFLQSRDSPYRPVHNVSTLLYPPPSAALQHRPQNIESNQMFYQPLGKPQQRHSGRIPYDAQNVWLDGSYGPEAMTPVNQWPSFQNYQQMISQQ